MDVAKIRSNTTHIEFITIVDRHLQDTIDRNDRTEQAVWLTLRMKVAPMTQGEYASFLPQYLTASKNSAA